MEVHFCQEKGRKNIKAGRVNHILYILGTKIAICCQTGITAISTENVLPLWHTAVTYHTKQGNDLGAPQESTSSLVWHYVLQNKNGAI